MENYDRLIEGYRECLVVRNFSKYTVKGNLSGLRIFGRYLQSCGIDDVAAVNKDTLQQYQTHCYHEINDRGEPNCVGTQTNRVKAVTGFFRYLYENGLIAGDPGKDIVFARRPKRLPRSIVSQAEMKKLLKMPDVRTVIGYRDRTMMELLYTCGLRASELLNLQLADVDYNDGFLRINAGKGNKDRVVPIGKIACRYLENYIKSVRPVLSSSRRVEGPQLTKDTQADTLFLSYTGAHLWVGTLDLLVREYTTRAGIKKKITPHTFRHTCATLMLRNKANIRHIQEMLGHESLDTTQLYTAVTIVDLKAVHSRCHPRVSTGPL